ncbi:MAG: hypothetical protein OCD01_17960 [Fibrobacterales bacterium]
MKKGIERVVVAVVALFIGWFIFLPPYLEVFQEEREITILINFFEFDKSKLSEIELWTSHDSLVWKIEAKEKYFQIPDLEFVTGWNTRSINIPDSVLQTINIIGPKGDSVKIEPGVLYKVVIKKPGLEEAWLKQSKRTEYIFTAQ